MKKPLPVERELNASAKSVDPGRPAQSAQADLGRNFLLSVNFVYRRLIFHPMTNLVIN